MKNHLIVLAAATFIYVITWVVPVNHDYRYVKKEVVTNEMCYDLRMASALFGEERTKRMLQVQIDSVLEESDLGWYEIKVRKSAAKKRIGECL